MIHLPTTLAAVRSADGTIRAGGTDLTDLRARGVATGPVVDLRDLPGLDTLLPTADGGLKIGALVTVARVAEDPTIRAKWPGFAAAAGALATPQIRARATIGGSLLQQVRCWYYRSPEFACLKKGGATCFARTGDAVFHSLLETGPCIAPHPSTMAMALLGYDGRVEVDGSVIRDVPTLLGKGEDPRQTHALGQGELLTAVLLPPPLVGEQAGYFRAISRSHAEWPLVEAMVRVKLDPAGAIAFASLVLGGIANRPQKYDDAARAAVGVRPDDPRFDDLMLSLVPKSFPLMDAAYKARLIQPTIREALDRALASAPA